MDIDELHDYCLALEGTIEKTSFVKVARRYDSILVFYVCGHMYCMLDMNDFSDVTVKLTPEEIDSHRLTYASVGKPVNLSERHWLQLDFGGDLLDAEIYTSSVAATTLSKLNIRRRRKCDRGQRPPAFERSALASMSTIFCAPRFWRPHWKL